MFKINYSEATINKSIPLKQLFVMILINIFHYLQLQVSYIPRACFAKLSKPAYFCLCANTQMVFLKAHVCKYFLEYDRIVKC